MTNLLYKTGNMNGLINRLRDSIQELPRFLNDGMDLPSNAEALSLAEFDDTAQLIYIFPPNPTFGRFLCGQAQVQFGKIYHHNLIIAKHNQDKSVIFAAGLY